MARHPAEKSSRQDLVVVNRSTVPIPLPLFSALEDTESACFEARSKQDPRDRHALEALA